MNRKIPVCPILSIGQDHPSVCLQENCAWYIQNLRQCGAYMTFHNAMLEIKEKQKNKEK